MRRRSDVCVPGGDIARSNVEGPSDRTTFTGTRRKEMEYPVREHEEVIGHVNRQVWRAGCKPTAIESVVETSNDTLPEGFAMERVAELRRQVH